MAKINFGALVSLVILALVTAQDFKCPDRTGFFPDPDQCDLYWVCSKGTSEYKLCPDGLVFVDGDPNHERCDIPANVDCEDRPALHIILLSVEGLQNFFDSDVDKDISTGNNSVNIQEEPKPSNGCPRANGYYRHSDPRACDKFFNCVDGSPLELPCPPGLIYDDVASTCAWPNESHRKDCKDAKRDALEDGFQCPEGDTMGPNGRNLPHPTFAHPEDCQKFYICRNGVQPQKGSCSAGSVYNEETFQCDEPKNVPGCENYYKKN